MGRRSAPAPEAIEVRYDLFDLPTAFHKAGLAGLILQLRSLKQRGILNAQDINSDPDHTSLTLRWTEPILRTVFDDLYAAKLYRTWVRSKWQGQEPVATETRTEIDPKTDEPKQVRWFAYDVEQPVGECLRALYPPMPEDRGWHKLWRDMLWAIPRGNPQTRKPYQDPVSRAKEAGSAWTDLVKWSANHGYTASVSSSLWPGTMDVNAERVPFEGRAEQNLLLHFWPLAVLVFVPDRFKAKQKDGELTIEYEPASYSLAVPEIADLREFVGGESPTTPWNRTGQYPLLLGELNKGLTPEQEVRGFRPARAVIDMPEEGALALMEHMAWLLGEKVQRTERLKRIIHAVDFIHLAKEGNNIKTLASGRITPRDNLLSEYGKICPRNPAQRPYNNPLFRRAILRTILDEQQWWQPFGKLFAEWQARFFVDSESPPKQLSKFWIDARKKFHHLEADMKDMAKTDDIDDTLGLVIIRIVRRYLDERVQASTGNDPRQFRKSKKSQTPKMLEERQKFAQELFMEFRSRREGDFAALFRDKLMKYGCWLKDEELLRLHRALRDETESVKTLAMLALSANSYVPTQKEAAQ